MSEPNKNAQSRTVPPRKKGGLGPLIALLLLAAMGAGVFFFFKNREGEMGNNTNANSQLPELPPLSSLNLPKPAETAKPENNASSQENNALSQNQPFNYSKPPEPIEPQKPIAEAPKPTEATPKPALAEAPKPIEQTKPIKKPTQAKSPAFVQKPKQNNISGKKIISSNRVKSGYSNFKAESFARPKPIKPVNANNKINANLIVPKQGLIAGSVASFLAYPEEHPLAVKPNQIITFQTKLFSKAQALNYANSHLASLGFNKIQIPIDDYARGGSTVIEAINEKTNQQVYFTFKPFYRANLETTAWKLELY